MSESHVVVEPHGHVLQIEFDRAEKYNAFDLAMYRDLSAAYGRLQADPDLRCGLVCARGDNFTAGLQLDQWTGVLGQGHFPDLPAGGCDPFGLRPERRLDKPLVFAVHGICFTVAIELMLAGDVRVCADDARFGQIEVRRGIFACGGATLRMVQEFGWGNAQRYLLTGDEFGAAEALRIGLVQEVTTRQLLRERGMELAQRIASRAPLAVYATLKSSRQYVNDAEQRAAPLMLPELMKLMGSEDVKEGVRSFLERREAKFQGR